MAENRIDLAGQWVRSVGGRDIDFVDVPGSFAPLGECALEREFDCPWAGEAGGRAFLVTEGVLATASFSVNGQEVGTAGPWATYHFELPAGLLRERNIIRARVCDITEAFGPTPGRRFDAGLVRPIWIERRPATFLEDMAFRAEPAEDFSSAACTVSVELNGGGGTVDVVLSERATGRVVGEGTATAARAGRLHRRVAPPVVARDARPLHADGHAARRAGRGAARAGRLPPHRGARAGLLPEREAPAAQGRLPPRVHGRRRLQPVRGRRCAASWA